MERKKLTKTQLKNKLKRQRAKRKCYRCGQVGHSRNKCPNENIIDDNNSKLVCFACRKPGHSIRNCPDNKDQNNDNGSTGKKRGLFCYNCGATGHPSRRCPKAKIGDGASYAECFKCKGTGHLAFKCPVAREDGKEVSVFPHGGSCHRCGSTAHKLKDCDAPRIADRPDLDKEAGDQAKKKDPSAFYFENDEGSTAGAGAKGGEGEGEGEGEKAVQKMKEKKTKKKKKEKDPWATGTTAADLLGSSAGGEKTKKRSIYDTLSVEEQEEADGDEGDDGDDNGDNNDNEVEAATAVVDDNRKTGDEGQGNGNKKNKKKNKKKKNKNKNKKQKVEE